MQIERGVSHSRPAQGSALMRRTSVMFAQGARYSAARVLRAWRVVFPPKENGGDPGVSRLPNGRVTVITDAQHNDGAKIVWSELEKKKAAIAAAAKQLAQREGAAARSLADMKRAEEALRAKEGQLLAEQARKNELWLIPDRTKTSKEPVLAVVSADAVVLQRFDHPEKSELRGRGLSSKFESALKDYSKLDQYVVFYFKPSGVDHFQTLTDSAKSAGFEIGYDAMGEEIAINFNTAR